MSIGWKDKEERRKKRGEEIVRGLIKEGKKKGMSIGREKKNWGKRKKKKEIKKEKKGRKMLKKRKKEIKKRIIGKGCLDKDKDNIGMWEKNMWMRERKWEGDRKMKRKFKEDNEIGRKRKFKNKLREFNRR